MAYRVGVTDEPSRAVSADPWAHDAQDRWAATRALALWADFPVANERRPIVLLHGDVHTESGFATGDAKMAFRLGMVESANAVDDEPVRRLRTPQASGPAPKSPLLVTSTTPGMRPFRTDRGSQTLPAWRVTAQDAIGPIWVLTDDAAARCWSPPPGPHGERLGSHILSSALLDPDGVGLTVLFVGDSERFFRYDSELIETDTAVTVVPLRRSTGALPPGTAITLEGHRRSVHVRLDQPLGSRVLVNHDGGPVEVNLAAA